MDVSSFINKIENEVDELKPGTLKPETAFRDLPEWSSMHALIIIALTDMEYDVTITGDDLRKCITINDIYTFIKSKKQ